MAEVPCVWLDDDPGALPVHPQPHHPLRPPADTPTSRLHRAVSQGVAHGAGLDKGQQWLGDTEMVAED